MNIVITYENSLYIGDISKKDYEFILNNIENNFDYYAECLVINLIEGYRNGINGTIANIFFDKDENILKKFTKIKFNEKININRHYINIHAYTNGFLILGRTSSCT